MFGLVYFITIALIFFPAIGFVLLKIASEETKQIASVRRTGVLFFVLQIANFLLVTVPVLLVSGGWNRDPITLFTFFILYAVALISLVAVVLLPESCQADRVVGRLLQIYVILFLILFIAGLMLAPLLHSLGSIT